MLALIISKAKIEKYDIGNNPYQLKCVSHNKIKNSKIKTVKLKISL